VGVENDPDTGRRIELDDQVIRLRLSIEHREAEASPLPRARTSLRP
jgi:hypothetical protein